MRAIINRLRRLENAATPADRERATVDAILEARRRRSGVDYVEPIPFPPESFAGCRTSADRIVRTRKLLMERQGNGGSRYVQYQARFHCRATTQAPVFYLEHPRVAVGRQN